jgi:hypothetical protein
MATVGFDASIDDGNVVPPPSANLAFFLENVLGKGVNFANYETTSRNS